MVHGQKKKIVGLYITQMGLRHAVHHFPWFEEDRIPIKFTPRNHAAGQGIEWIVLEQRNQPTRSRNAGHFLKQALTVAQGHMMKHINRKNQVKAAVVARYGLAIKNFKGTVWIVDPSLIQFFG